MKGPFGVLYVLLVSRLDRQPGRYQTPQPLSYDELELFLYEHQGYFECDGRHHLWVSSMSGEGQFIYDNHNFIYAYDDINSYVSKLSSNCFIEGEINIQLHIATIITLSLIVKRVRRLMHLSGYIRRCSMAMTRRQSAKNAKIYVRFWLRVDQTKNHHIIGLR